jgi:hypothetical protein
VVPLPAKKSLKPPIFVELLSLADLGRLTCAMERIPIPIFKFTLDKDDIFAAQIDIFKGTPIIYFLKLFKGGGFLGYRNDGGKEIVSFSNSTNGPISSYSPIISLDRIPKIFEQGYFRKKVTKDRYLSMNVTDLTSLSKITSYRILYEDLPLPLFSFPKGRKWIIGSFARLDDSDELALFFYIEGEEKNNYPFIRYSSRNPDKTEIVDKFDEIGYIYIKIIQLSEIHPLVEI